VPSGPRKIAQKAFDTILSNAYNPVSREGGIKTAHVGFLLFDIVNWEGMRGRRFAVL